MTRAKVPTTTQPHRQQQDEMPTAHRWLHLLMGFLSVLWVLPMLLVVSISLTDEQTLLREGFGLIPRKFSLAAYQYLLADPSQLLRAYGVSIFVTVVGTFISLLVMTLLAYAISRPEFKYRNLITFFIFFPMLFNGGLVASYIINTRYLGLGDSLWALILPALVVPFFVLLLRTYFATLPNELLEAARIDGASEWLIYWRIALPLSTPAIATVGLFLILMFWNDYFLALVYITSLEKSPLQLLLFNILNNVETLSRLQTSQVIAANMPTQSVRMAMAVLATGPVLLAFLFLQRYFVRGLTVGSLKG